MSIFRRYFCIIDENMTSSVNDNNPNHLNIDKYCSLIEDVYSKTELRQMAMTMMMNEEIRESLLNRNFSKEEIEEIKSGDITAKHKED